MMTRDTLIDEIHAGTDLRRTFKEIREALEKAGSREDLTELYKQTVYMILMTHSSPLNQKDREMKRRRESAEREFARTVRMINRRAKKIGVDADYSEDWENLATNNYETEGENLLEAQNTGGIARK
ncbi:MAG TPA: hypothetical protein VMN99_00110 [Anaerolineales bacterium]|nr:hypothetical protein [Anaerolineales bacterium]